MPTRFSSAEIQDMIAMYESGLTVAAIAQRFACQRATVSRALKLKGVRIVMSGERLRGTGKGRVQARHEWRRRKRENDARLAGKVYIPREERLRIAREKRLAPKPPRPVRASIKRAFLQRYLEEHPDVAAEGLTDSALEYRARYLYDEAFRAREIERLHKRKTAKMPSDGTLDSVAIRRLFAEASCCLYCGKSMRSTDKTLDHIEPRSRGGWHSIRNAVICCKRCNTAKGAKSPAAWIQRVDIQRRTIVRSHLERVLGYALEQAPLGLVA